MAIPLERGTPTSVGTVGTSATLPKPTGVVSGDLVVVWALSANGGTLAALAVTGGSAWSTAGAGVSTIYGSARVFYKIAGGAEPASYTVTGDGGDVQAGAIAYQSGTFDPTTPIPATGFAYASTTTTTTTYTAPSVTGVVDGVLLACFASVGTAVSAPTFAGYSGGLVEELDSNAGASGFGGIAVASLTLAAAGATGTFTATSTSRRALTSTVVVAPFTGPQNLARTGADTAAVSDGAARVATASRTAGDTLAAADTLLAARGKAAGDSAAVADAASVLQAQQRIIADSAGASDSVVRVLHRAEIIDSQWVFDMEPHVPFGLGQTIMVEKFDPGAAEDRNQDVISPVESVRLFGTDLKTPPTWSWDMYTDVQSEAEALGWAENLAEVWDPEGIRRTPNAVVRLRYGAGGRLRCVFGRPGNFTFIPGDLLWAGKGLITADFRLAENLFFEDVEDNTGVLRILPDSSGPGWKFPLKFPVKSAIPSNLAQVGQARIGGRKRTPLCVDFHGPVVNPWILIGEYQWALRGTVENGETVTLSGLPWDLGVRRSDGTPLPGMLDPRARLSQLRLPPGLYPVRFGGFDPTGSSSAMVRWRDAYGVM